MPRLFNAYVMVDWSAAAKKTTGANSVWVGVLKRDVRFRFAFESHNPGTRKEAETLISGILDDRAKHRDRTLIGFDFALGYPRGLAGALNLPGEQPWQAMWAWLGRRVTDKADNTNNRFSVASDINRRLTEGPFPFWGCTPRDALTTLQPTKARPHGPGDLPEFRHTELTANAKGASSVWKLGMPGSVGGQTILGIPLVKRLKEARGDRMKIWPFETGWKALTENELSGVDVVAAEVYPSMIKPDPVAGEIKDQTQVRTLAEYFSKTRRGGKTRRDVRTGQGHRPRRDPRRPARGRLDAGRLRRHSIPPLYGEGRLRRSLSGVGESRPSHNFAGDPRFPTPLAFGESTLPIKGREEDTAYSAAARSSDFRAFSFSATKNASSSACSPFSLGSQWV